MPFELNTVPPQILAQQFLARFRFLQADLRCPLKRSVRFRYKCRDTGSDLTPMIACRGHLTTEVNNA